MITPHFDNSLRDLPADKKIVLASIARFKKLAEDAGVDTLISSHQTRDLSLHNLEIARLRRAGAGCRFVSRSTIGGECQPQGHQGLRRGRLEPAAGTGHLRADRRFR